MPKKREQKNTKHPQKFMPIASSTRNNSQFDSSSIRRQARQGQKSQDLPVVLAPDPTLSSIQSVKRRVNVSSPPRDGERAILHNTPVDPSMYHAQQITIRGDTFAGAHDFIIQHANIGDGIQREEWRLAEQERRVREEWINQEYKKARLEARNETERRAEEERQRQTTIVLEKLIEKGLPSAMIDSKERAYAPSCNEGTRQTIRNHIVKWVRGEKEAQLLLWLFGPAAVGKSAVAQSVAEELKVLGLLGAVFFFSRPNNRSDPDVVIPTLVYQLTLILPDYRLLVTRKLIADPILLNRNRRTQFNELITEPILALGLHQPLLIILDGLDECSDRLAQVEFIEMISDYVRKGGEIPLRWMICSRVEPDLKAVFSSEACKGVYLYKGLKINDHEARNDAMRILTAGFQDIRKRFPDQVTQEWPAEDQIQTIADRASGHLGFVSFII
ncbi:hypothetical protein NP233_g9077 [Leucocoprinus birnbaumii]|uniref:Nephrocystin 3-like N-terminal domain-containing protein n=1 Tax=Leucocoprinus birnbaumii TaxID=56174 RepID=A0AAD5VRR7_9AGAR|nr:hypothetical protein NP233_g9077 [Leucocoprinus birnbaumii]